MRNILALKELADQEERKFTSVKNKKQSTTKYRDFHY